MRRLWVAAHRGGKGEAMANHQGYMIAYLVGLLAKVNTQRQMMSRIACVDAA